MNEEEIPAQPEDIPGRPIALTLIATVATILVCVFVVWLFMSRDLHGDGDNHMQSIELIPPAPPFEVTSDLERIRTAQYEELEQWTWADRAHQIVRLPVSAAIDRYLQQRGGK